MKDADLPAKSLLLIDDNLDLLEVQQMVLESAGYKAYTAQSGAAAFALLEQQKVDLILLDMRMEDMSGTDFLLMLEQKRPDIMERVPVVFHTGLTSVPLGKAAGFIRKAGSVDEFLKAVRSYV